jgi:hypothetical protein
MSDLNFLEKRTLENCFRMGGGYVLDFSDRTFAEFVVDSVGLDIYDDKYRYASGSKANRLRGFWKVEPNHVVGKLVVDLTHCALGTMTAPPQNLVDACMRIAQRLLAGAPALDVLSEATEFDERTLQLLVKSIQEAINRNEPEAALDRLHTYVLKYMRSVCERHGIDAARDKPLHGLLGGYAKHLREAGLIESEMTDRILKSNISNLEFFNRVRNEHSLAHDNELLKYHESLLVFNHVVSLIRFIRGVEQVLVETQREAPAASDDDDIPF